jgi:NADH dehydrogenase/NADH:ubiquinone oxidoreductase subunit G
MSAHSGTPGPLYKPYQGLVKIKLIDKEFEVPEGNMLLRAFQYLSPDDVAMGRFCWNEECQYCRVKYDTGEGTPVRTALACKTIVQDGMRVVETASEVRYCLRKLGLDRRGEQRD